MRTEAEGRRCGKEGVKGSANVAGGRMVLHDRRIRMRGADDVEEYGQCFR